MLFLFFNPPLQVCRSDCLPTSEQMQVLTGNLFTSRNVILPPLKLMFNVMGILLPAERTNISRILYAVWLVRMITCVVPDILEIAAASASVTVFSTLVVHYICPAAQYFYLIENLTKFNRKLDEHLCTFNLRIRRSISLHSMRKLNVMCFAVVIVQYFVWMLVALVVVGQPRNWVISHTVPAFLQLNHVTASVIAYLVHAYDTVGSNFIPMITSLYLCYFRVIINLKSSVLASLMTLSKYEARGQVNRLDELIDTFETYLSHIPLTVLFFATGNSLIFILSISEDPAGQDLLDMSASIIANVLNIFVALLSLFVVSRWQEAVDCQVTSLNRFISERCIRPLDRSTLNMVNTVIMRKVTVCLTFPIDRSLIFAYMGVAITFSTLFKQMTSNGGMDSCSQNVSLS